MHIRGLTRTEQDRAAESKERSPVKGVVVYKVVTFYMLLIYKKRIESNRIKAKVYSTLSSLFCNFLLFPIPYHHSYQAYSTEYIYILIYIALVFPL